MTFPAEIEAGARAGYEYRIRTAVHVHMTWDELGAVGQAEECQAFAAGLKVSFAIDSDGLIETTSDAFHAAIDSGLSPWSAFIEAQSAAITYLTTEQL